MQIIFLFLSFLCLTQISFAQKIAVADSLKTVFLKTSLRDSLRNVAKDSLQKHLALLMTETDMQNATFGFCAMYASADSILLSQNAKQSISTASVMKTISTSTALNLLGKDFRFETILEYDGEIKDSILYGNIYIKGGGDPTLAIENIEKLLCEWIYAIEKQGIKTITGSIIADESIFDNKAVHNRWVWEDVASGYGAGSYGLSFHENLYYIRLKSGNKEGDATSIQNVYPPIENLTFYNNILTGAKNSGDNSLIYGSPDTYIRNLSGTIPPNETAFILKGAIPNPPLYCATSLHNLLYYNKITVLQFPTTYQEFAKIKDISTLKRIKFYTTYSEPLSEIIRVTNYKSINLYAENFLRILAYQRTGQGTTEAGVQVITEYLQNKGINLQGFFMEDGSGLSRFNAILPEQLTRIMHLQTKQANFPVFYQSLPLVGESGTVRNLCKNTVAEGKIRAKSGSMTRVRCYTGYVQTKSGEKLVFSMMANNYSGKGTDMVKRMEKIMVLMAGLDF
jgi:D-alanyl-D-alanine carboxypeptidase/D-alanyl-D-alanine-endopeptidase (penicillin-binding protein 4)